MQGITYLDIGLLILFLYFILGGYNKGFIKQTSTILGLVFALFIAINYYREFQPVIRPYLNVSPEMLQFLSFALLFVAINLFFHILGRILKNILNLLFLQPLDHVAGALLGLVKGGVFAYLLVLILAQVPHDEVIKLLDSSYLATGLLDMTPIIHQSLQHIFRP